MDWESASDKEILDQLRKAELAERLEYSEEWKLIHESMKRTYEGHIKLLKNADPSDTNTITQLQQICKLYAEDFLPALIRNFQTNREYLGQEAKRRNLLQRFLDSFK